MTEPCATVTALTWLLLLAGGLSIAACFLIGYEAVYGVQPEDEGRVREGYRPRERRP